MVEPHRSEQICVEGIEMPSKRFEKAAVLAEKLKTWNHNDVALAVKESLETESQNSWVYGLSKSAEMLI